MVLSQRLTAQFAFLLVIAGYNPRKDRSLNDRLYLVYVVIFFSIWIFMVLTLFADWAVKILSVVSPHDVLTPAVSLLLAILLLWGAYKLWQAAKTSPIVFSEEDAALLCLTPVNRRVVTVMWFIYRWMLTVLPFAAMAVVLGFAQVEWQFQGKLGMLDLPLYTGAGLLAMIAMALAQLLVQALVWLFGLLRLRSDSDIPHYRWVAVAIIAVFLTTALRLPDIFSILTIPLRSTLETAMGTQSSPGLLLSAVLPASVVLALLWYFSDRLNLSRAAQETAYLDKMQAAMFLGDVDTVNALKIKKRLGSSHTASRMPLYEGGAAILWRSLIQSRRAFNFASAGRIVLLIAATLAIFLAPDTGSWILVLATWTLLLGQLSAGQLRGSLKNWWLWTQQPYSIRNEIIWQILPSGLLILLVAWIGLLLIPLPNALLMALILPFAIFAVMLAGVIDVLRQVRTELLVAERIPVYSIVGTLFGLLLLVLPFWFYLQPVISSSYLLVAFWGITEVVLLWQLTGTIWKNRK
jgi:hypothetical protein